MKIKWLVAAAVCAFVVWQVEAARAALYEWDFDITGSQVRNNPPPSGTSPSGATGIGHVQYDTATNVVSYNIGWSDLEGFLTKIHIHGPAGSEENNATHLIEVLEFVFPDTDETGTITLPDDGSGTYTGNRTTGSFSNSHLLEGHAGFTPNEILDFMKQGQTYVNVHSESLGMGEIRGNLPVIPEPASIVMLAAGGLLVMGVRRRRIG